RAAFARGPRQPRQHRRRVGWAGQWAARFSRGGRPCIFAGLVWSQTMGVFVHWLLSLLLGSGRPGRPPARAKPRLRLGAEALEDRAVPSTLHADLPVASPRGAATGAQAALPSAHPTVTDAMSLAAQLHQVADARAQDNAFGLVQNAGLGLGAPPSAPPAGA